MLVGAILGIIIIIVFAIQKSVKKAAFKRKAARIKALIKSKSVVTNVSASSIDTIYRLYLEYSLDEKGYSSYFDTDKEYYDALKVGDMIWIHCDSEHPYKVLFDGVKVKGASNQNQENETMASQSRPNDDKPCSTNCKVQFCRRCGSKLLEDSEFCSNCGTKVNV